MEEFSQPSCVNWQPKHKTVRNHVKVSLIICLVGTCIAVFGAALRTSNVEWTENLGVVIHQIGMMVMLLGFGSLFYYRKLPSKQGGTTKFSWTEADGKLIAKPFEDREVLDISAQSESPSPMVSLETLDLVGIRCLIARGQNISKPFASRLVKQQKLIVLDLQNAILESGVLQELESLETLEILLLSGCIQPLQAKELRIALPEARMVFDARKIVLQRPVPTIED